ncbi:MAG: ATP-binding protein [Opitutaceae bacterium]|nr:ATP-binding protein [Opitutaceae bacterium]
MKNWSLRTKLTFWSVIFSTLALLVFGASVAIELYSDQNEITQKLLAAEVGMIFRNRTDNSEHELDNLAWLMERKGPLHLYGYVLRRSKDGSVLGAKPSQLAHVRIPKSLNKRNCFTHSLGGRRLQICASTQEGMTLLLAATDEEAMDALSELLDSYLFAYPIVLLVVPLGSWWIARQTFKPIVKITNTAAAITADRLGDRMPVPATNDEIGCHIRVLNDMLDRLQRSFEQANRFTADAAHELRTPLTIMRGQLEDALRSEHLTPEQEELLVDLLEETTGLQKISDNLLLLARFDTGKSTLRVQAIDFSALVEEAREDAELLASPKQIRISAEIAPGIRVNGDAVMLRRVLVNLIDNAVKFNISDGEVRLALRPDKGQALLTVANTGHGIPAHHQNSLFKRFSRPDNGRNREAGGSGLGLSLSREIVVAHKGQIELTSSDAQWTKFSVRLPLLAAGTQPPKPSAKV